MGDSEVFRPANKIGAMLVSSRSLAEYQAMFALTDADLARSILDCPGGAASFTAEVTGAGGRVMACDPIYVRPTQDITELSMADMRRAQRYQREHPDGYVWSFFDGPAHYLASRFHAADMFSQHRDTSPEQYIVAALPTLPFADQAFDLALSSHLLFAYADRFDRDFHLDSIRELVRVAREVRVYPLVPFGYPDNPALPALIDHLYRTGVTAETQKVDYELHRGATTMLRIVQS
jgi:hypothetical protein